MKSNFHQNVFSIPDCGQNSIGTFQNKLSFPDHVYQQSVTIMSFQNYVQLEICKERKHNEPLLKSHLNNIKCEVHLPSSVRQQALSLFLLKKGKEDVQSRIYPPPLTTAHPWCGSHPCGVLRAKAGIQVSRKELHTHIYFRLGQSINYILYICIYIYINKK